MKGKILQIIPAVPGWYERSVLEDDEVCDDPVICWVLLDDDGDGYRKVVGMVQEYGTPELLPCEWGIKEYVFRPVDRDDIKQHTFRPDDRK